jgi:hypothetical protein
MFTIIGRYRRKKTYAGEVTSFTQIYNAPITDAGFGKSKLEKYGNVTRLDQTISSPYPE